jgi:flagellar biosynthesis protein FliR
MLFSDVEGFYCDLAFAVNTSFLYCFIGNTLWGIAIGYYIYILFLGFSGKTQLFDDNELGHRLY